MEGSARVDETPHLLNPRAAGSTTRNNWPWSGGRAEQSEEGRLSGYVESGSESARGLHAVRVLENKKDFTLDSLIAAAYDSYLTWFEKPLPALIKAWDDAPASNPLKAKLAEQIALLRQWDLRWSVNSVPTSLAVSSGRSEPQAASEAPCGRRLPPLRTRLD